MTSSMRQKPHDTWNAIDVSLVRVCLHGSANAFQQYQRLPPAMLLHFWHLPRDMKDTCLWSTKHDMKHDTKQRGMRNETWNMKLEMRHETWSMKHDAKHMTWTWHMTWRRKHDMKQDMKHEMKHDAWSRWLMMWSMKHDMKQDINHTTKASWHLNSDSCLLGPCLPSCFCERIPIVSSYTFDVTDKTWKTHDWKHGSSFHGPRLPSCFFLVSAFQQYQRLSTFLHDKTWKT